MALVIRENDIDMDKLRERVTHEAGEAACCGVLEAMAQLDGLRRLREQAEGTHEVMRALEMVHIALADAFNL